MAARCMALAEKLDENKPIHDGSLRVLAWAASVVDDLWHERLCRELVFQREAITYEWEALEHASDMTLGALRSEGWIARLVTWGDVPVAVACRPVGATDPAEGWQSARVGDELRSIGVAWPERWPDHGTIVGFRGRRG